MAQNSMRQNLESGRQNIRKSKSRLLMFGILVTLLVVGVIFYFAYNSVTSEEQKFDQGVAGDLKNINTGRAAEVNTWLKSVVDNTARFTNSDLVRIFSEEMDNMGSNVLVLVDKSKDQSASDNLDMQLMNNHLRDFIVYADFLYAGLSNRNGDIYIATDASHSSMAQEEQELVRKVMDSGTMLFGPAEANTAYGLVMPLYLPINSFGKDASGKPRTVAVLILIKSIGPKLNELFASSGSSKNMISLLLQKNREVFQNIAFSRSRVQDISVSINQDSSGGIPFAECESVLGEGKKVYSQGVKLPMLDWWIMTENDYELSREELVSLNKSTYTRAGLISLVFVLLIGVIWWWLVGFERSQVLNKFQELFKVIEEQKRLLDSINSTISDPISLTDAKGIYLYVNRAFAKAVGREANEIPGLDISAVFGFDTAKRMNSSDQHVLMTGEELTNNETIWLQSKRNYFQISKTPLRDNTSRTPIGIVSVYRNMTSVVETEERTHRVVQQTINALVQAIEKTDPFLGGHSRIMGEVARLIAKGMNLPEKDTSTLTAAATLSQIGKLFVPREVLTKPGILTAEEKKIMETHVEHTKNILKDIEFDLPVMEAIAQMNERLDGKGYPAGLSGDEINIYARILAVANAFTAMARPRSYRLAMDVETVLSMLEKQADYYDQNVVTTLRMTLETPEGEKLINSVLYF